MSEFITVNVWRYDSLITRAGRRNRPVRVPAGYTIRDVVTRCMAMHPDRTAVIHNHTPLKNDDALGIVLEDDDVLDLAPSPGLPPVVSAILTIVSIAAAVASALLLPSVRLPSGDRERQRRFAFDRFSSDAVVGEPIPVALGRRVRHGGRIVSEVPVESVDGQSKARILINLGRGELSAIGDQTADFDDLAPSAGGITGVFINDQDAENFQGVRIWGRMGTAGQAVIPGFDDTEVLQDVGPAGGALLANTSGVDRTGPDASGEAFLFTTTTGVDAAIIRIRFPEGLFTAASSGRPLFRKATFRFRWRINDVGGGAPGAWSSWQTSTVERDESSPFTIARRIDGLDPADGELDIQVERVSPEPTGLADRDEMRWISLIEVQYSSNAYTHPDGSGGFAMLAVEIVANEQLSGSTPRISVDVQGVKMRLKKDGAMPDDIDPWEASFGYSDNPAAQALALLENDAWGMGQRFGLASVDLTSLFEWWDVCDEDVDRYTGSMDTRKRYRSHFTLRDVEDGWEQLLKICRAGRAVPQLIGGVVRFVQDQPQAAPIEIFTHGSLAIEDDGEGGEGLSLPGPRYRRELTVGGITRPNRIIGVFENANERGEQDTIAWPEIGEQWLATETPREESVRLEGVTDPDQAMAAAIHLAKQLRLEAVTVEFETSHEIVRVQPGERFDLAWSPPGWGAVSGRVKRLSTSTELLIDEPFEMAMGVDYNAIVTFPDGTRETRAVASTAVEPDGSTRVALNSALSGDPDAFAEYAIEVDGVGLKPFILEEISLADSANRIWRLRGREYIEAVHDDTPDAEVVTPAFPTLAGPGIPPGPVIDLTATVEQVGGRDVVRLAWQQSPFDAAHTASFSVYRRQTGTPFSLEPVRNVASTTVVLDLVEGLMEEFTVVAVSQDGAQLSPNAAPVASIEVEPPDGDATPTALGPAHEAPTSPTITEPGDGTATLSWTKPASDNPAEYRVELAHTLADATTLGWHNFGYVLKRVMAPATSLADILLPAGFTAWLGVRSVTSQGRLSQSLATDSIVASAPPGESVIASADLDLSVESVDIEGGWVNLSYDATTQRLRLVDPTTGGQWTSDRISLGGAAIAVRLRWLLGAALDMEIDAQLDELDWEVPSIESDLVRMGDAISPTEPRLGIPPLPDSAVDFEVQVSWTTEAGDTGWGPFTTVENAGELLITARQVQFRVIMTRSVFPFLPALGDFYFAATA